MEPAIRAAPDEVEARLAELGLGLDDLRQPLADGAVAMAQCGERMPPMFPPLAMWATANASLRERLEPRGWTSSDAAGVARVVRGDSKVQLIISLGNAGTGDAQSDPDTQHPRGEGYREILRFFGMQNRLWDGPERVDVKRVEPPADAPETWILLHRTTKDRIACELLRPKRLSESGHIEGWHERLMLPAVTVSTSEVEVPPEQPASVEVDVQKKAQHA